MAPFRTAGLIVLLGLLPVGRAHASYQVGDTEHGRASWYGGDWQGTATASGVRFDKNKLTAAHRHLPFGTIIRVTNCNNGRSVEVRIIDRGPWSGSRILDVSEAAANILEMKKAGIVPVDILVVRLGPEKKA